MSVKADYQVFKIRKKSGGWRQIEAPNTELKRNQQKLYERLMTVEIPTVSPFAHAFVPWKNIYTMASQHVKKKFILAFDLEDFFPSIKWEAFRGHLMSMYEKVDANVELITLADQVKDCSFTDFEDNKGLRLPQGAVTSPALSNLYMYRWDWRMAHYCAVKDIVFTRYADDIVLSSDTQPESIMWQTLIVARNTLKDMGLKINDKKIRLMTPKKKQIVCGLVVNEKVNIPRRWRKRLRAEMFQQKGQDLRLETKGRLAFCNMVYNNKLDNESNIDVHRRMKAVWALK
jgi:hypothetical protein